MAVGSSTAVNALVSNSAANTTTNRAMIAQNFDTFLQLLTTQLKNQNPLEPLDTNQFTQQLVQFAQVEQQIKTNDSLSSMVTSQKAMQTNTAVQFLGQTVTFQGNSAALSSGKATWGYSLAKPATVTFTVKSNTGQTIHTENRTVAAGAQNFVWNGRDARGATWPDANYTLSVSAKDAAGQSVGISTEVEGVVDGVDVSQSAPMLLVGAQRFALDQIKHVRHRGG